MCNWFSCVSDGEGYMYSFNEEHRQAIYDGKELACKVGANPIRARGGLDSHSALCSFYGLDCDKVNKYEFRPLDRHFKIDQINTTDDSKQIKRKLQRLDYRKLAPPELIFKPIIHPFKLNRKRVTHADLILLKKWESVENSVLGSVGNSVRNSVRDSVNDSVGNSVGTSVRASVWASVWASVNDSVRNSVWASVWAYTGSFFNLPKWKYIKHNEGEYPFQSAVDLWEKGLVPSFDGKVWRLHGGKDGRVLKEISKEELSKLTEVK